MKSSSKVIAISLSSAFILSMVASSVNAAENPFAIKSLSNGYQVANHHEEKAKDGKCGEGKCGSEMKDMKMKDMEMKDKDIKDKDMKDKEMKDKSMKKVDVKAKDGK